MPRTEKAEKVNELAERIRNSEALFIADYRGLTVAEVTELRRSLRDTGTRFMVAKNTLLKRAAGEAGAEGLDDLLAGPTAVAFVDGDPIGAAKGLVDAIRRFRTLEIRGGFMEGKVMSSEEAQALATIEPREVLLAKIAGALKAEMSRAAYMFQGLQSKFLSVLEAYREKLPGEEPAEEPAAAAGADTAEAEPEAAPEAAASPADEIPPAGETADEEAPAAETAAEPEGGETAAEAEAEPEGETAAEPEAEAADEPEAPAEPEAEAAAEPEAAEEPEAGSAASAGPEPEDGAEAENSGEAESEPETTDETSADASEPAEEEGKE